MRLSSQPAHPSDAPWSDENSSFALWVDGLIKRYGTLTAVNGVSFCVPEGEVFGLLGPNGAGKTTTLEIVEGLRRPDGGRVLVFGADVTQSPRRVREKIGVQLQDAGLFERLTLAETLHTFAAFHKRHLPVDRLLKRLHLMEKAKSLVENLSGGQRQRLSIALALLNDPKLVFLDEPTTGLDPQARRNLWDVIKEIRAEGRTVVLTTHYMEEAAVLCDRVAIMDHGQIIALDTPAQLVRAHAPDSKVHLGLIPTTVSNEFPMTRLAELPGVIRVESRADGGDGDMFTLHTLEPQQTLHALLDAARASQLSYRRLSVEESTLEDVFLNLTGRRLRD